MSRLLFALLAACIWGGCATDAAVTADASVAPNPATPAAAAATAHLIFLDRSASAYSESAYDYARAAVLSDLRQHTTPGDILRVYGIQSNTADNSPYYDQRLPSLSVTPDELAEYGALGGSSKKKFLAKKRKRYDRAVEMALGHLARLSEAGLSSATQGWTDIDGLFALARNAQRQEGGPVRLTALSDMVHSTPEREMSKARLRDAATAKTLGSDHAERLRADASTRGLDWTSLSLTVYFPRLTDDVGAYPSLVRAYWEGFAEVAGMKPVSFHN